MRKLLITGASGFVGRHAIDRAPNDCEVTVTGRGRRPEWLSPAVAWLSLDLRDPAQAQRLAADWWGVLHLAAETVPSAFVSVQSILDSLAMFLNMAYNVGSARLLYVSSCHVYAPGNADKQEDSQLRPDGHYGLSKLLCETAALTLPNVDLRIARPFNHLGPAMRSELVIPAITRRVLAAKQGDTLEMMGQDSVRDFLDVTDIVDAYYAILRLERPDARVFNVCSGTGIRISAIVKAVAAAVGRAVCPVFKEKPMSADDVSRLVGDPTRLSAATDWVPQVNLDISIARIVAAHR